MDMHERVRAGMLEATRLVGAGSLVEATALIQRALRGMPVPDATVAADPTANVSKNPPIEGVFRVMDDTFISAKSPAQELLSPFRLQMPPHWQGDSDPAVRPIPVRDETPDVAPGGRFLSGSYSNHAGSRTYKLYIPSGYHGQTLPLVVMLHGCKQNPDDFAIGTRMNILAEEHQCFVVYPAQAQSANGSNCWNWFKTTDQQRDRGEPSIIAGITRQIINTYPVDKQRVYVAGLSAGGAMAATMGMTYPDLYAAVGVHSGLPHAVAHDLPSALAAMHGGAVPSQSQYNGIPGAGQCRQAVPTIVFHGDRDTKVHPSNGDKVTAQSTTTHIHGGANTKTEASPRVTVQRGQVPGGHAYTRATHLDGDGKTIVEQWRIHGAGHAWSGGSPRGSYTDPRGPDATREMMRFFYEHPAREGGTVC